MSETRSAKPVRLRLACDACTTAKVRCSRTHPCERCEDNGQAKECCYSASRRHGKRARQRKSAQDSGGLTTQFTSAWEDYSTYSTGNLEMLDSWASRTVDFDDGNGISWVDPWRSLGFVSDTTASQSSGMVSPDLSLSTEPTLSIKASDPTAMHSHDCEALALKVLRSLHCNTNTDQKSSPIPQKQTCSTPSIDTVLSVNKAALTNLIPLLKCHCARNPHIAMLHSAILSKVIFWYRVAVTARYHTDGVELRPMKIQLGMLDLDDEDQATLQRTVVLRELRKAEKVMETFDSFAGGDDGGLNWHVVAVRNMREELQGIIQKIKKGQGEMM
ncbi:fusarubin cluster-transcription factor [Fusarium musae]|uniref:Fusarubin cluster-transcription factor n=1 Tax=Fusarium musae TaxID=1042133 RepID=A0A9P8DL51_9HYPO|nr:fusarubin cluster-transcription factor [Fusarium musae]KAG9503757.1 fusarubin cluster-transcription factor [Fusarium musae]